MNRIVVTEEKPFRAIFTKHIFKSDITQSISGREIKSIKNGFGEFIDFKKGNSPGIIFNEVKDLQSDSSSANQEVAITKEANFPITIKINKLDKFHSDSEIKNIDSVDEEEYLVTDTEIITIPTLTDYLHFLIHQEGAKLLFTNESKPLMFFSNASTKEFPQEYYLTADKIEKIVNSILNERQKEILDKKREVSITFNVRNLSKFRANIYYQRGLMSLSICPIGSKKEITIPKPLEKIITDFKKGSLCLVTGTNIEIRNQLCVTLLDILDKQKPRHILTLENQIQIELHNRFNSADQREYGVDWVDTELTLQNIIGYHPDVIYVRHDIAIEHLISYVRLGAIVIFEDIGISPEDIILNMIQRADKELGTIGKALILSLLNISISIDGDGIIDYRVVDRVLKSSIKESDGLCLVK